MIATNNNFAISSQVVDYTSTNVLLVQANSEVDIQLPGINKIVAVNLSSDQLFDVALTLDGGGQPVYSGMFGTSYARLIKDGAILSTFKIKASATDDAIVKLSVVGLESL